MITYDIKVELSNGIKDKFTIHAKDVHEAKRMGYSRVTSVLDKTNKKLKIKDLEVVPWVVDF